MTGVGEVAIAEQPVINSIANIMTLRKIFIQITTFTLTNESKKRNTNQNHTLIQTKCQIMDFQASKYEWQKSGFILDEQSLKFVPLLLDTCSRILITI